MWSHLGTDRRHCLVCAGASGEGAGPIACGFMSGDGGAKRAEMRGEGSDLIGLLRRYVVQETVDPLKEAGRTLLFGSAAAILMGIGAVLLLLGALRVLQTETGTVFRGSLSWLPYGITAFAAVVVIAAGGLVLLRSSGSKRANSRVKARGRKAGGKRRGKAAEARSPTATKQSEVA
jgi:hypothetical protein